MDVSVEEGVLDLQEKELIDNVTEFGELRVGDVMTQKILIWYAFLKTYPLKN